MKKWIKISLGIIIGVILLFVIDLICIFTINRPIFAIKLKTPYAYSGVFYDVYNCPEYSTPQIKSKWTKFYCAENKNKLIVKEIIDTTKNIKEFSCDTALEKFYQDEEYVYYWNCIKNNYMLVKYENGFEELISNALKNETIKISDLDRFNINYIKEINKITLENINEMITNYINNNENDKDNYVHNYIDTKRNKVVVELVNNTKEKQEIFISKVFSECCGSMYIKYIKENSLIDFEESK